MDIYVYVSEFSRDQMELPWQPNLGKNNAKLHKFQLCIRYWEICFVNVFEVHEFKYAMRIFKGAKGVATATKFGQK